MNSFARKTAISSLQQLESYYQSRYESYLAMAMSAKEHRERVELLLQDLLEDESYQGEYRLESTSVERKPDELGVSPENGLLKTELSLPSAKIASVSSTESINDERKRSRLGSLFHARVDDLEFKERGASTQVEQMSRLIEDLSSAMSVLKSVFNSDSGKTLHKNYLQKILNQELKQELSTELVELYLEEAVTRGYVERDEYDRNCYIAQAESSKINTLAQTDNSKGRGLGEPPVGADIRRQTHGSRSSRGSEPSSEPATSPKGAAENRQPRVLQNGDVSPERVEDEKSQRSNQSRKLYNLPPSPKLKPTLLETVNEYIAKFTPKRFSIVDVVNYLYPDSQQLNWSKTRKNKVRQAIANVLGRSDYLGKHWKRIKPGVYRPKT